MRAETTTREGYEFIENFDLPPLPGMLTDDEVVYWDLPSTVRVPVDFSELVRMGYCRRVRITETKEYI